MLVHALNTKHGVHSVSRVDYLNSFLLYILKFLKFEISFFISSLAWLYHTFFLRYGDTVLFVQYVRSQYLEILEAQKCKNCGTPAGSYLTLLGCLVHHFTRLCPTILSLWAPITQNSQTHSNNLSVDCRRIVWVCLTIV